MQAQAVAFSMFVAFFPMLLFAVGVISMSTSLQGEIKELSHRLSVVLPPDSERVVLDYLLHHTKHSLDWILLGLGGTLLAGTQVMIGLMDGFRIIAGDETRPSFWHRQARALLLLCLTIAPWLAAVVLTVFGRQVRAWIVREFGLPKLVQGIWTVIYLAAVLLLVLGVLTALYRFGRSPRGPGGSFLPGALVTTVLWWVLDASFGWYVRQMPYGAVYGGLAAAIGLLLWMYMTAIVMFLGAAYNVESAARPRGS
jgi:membrane protein